MAGIRTPIFKMTIGTINFDGKPNHQKVHSIEVDLQSDAASSFKVMLDDSDGEFSSGKLKIKEGDACTIQLGLLETSGLNKVIEGQVTNVKGNRKDGSRKVVEISGFDGLQALTRGKKRRSWENIKDSDIASIIAGECGLGSGKIEDSGIIQPFVTQNNETNLSFLYERARRLGFEVKVIERDLAFRKV
jgi:phage protein D